MGGDLTKKNLYEGVKTILESGHSHIQFVQPKLFTLSSIAFQYFLFLSTKNPGDYLIRIEDGPLAEKAAKRSKDPSTRKFLQTLLLPRKLKFDKSCLYLDFFHVGTWQHKKDLHHKLQGALIIPNPMPKPMNEVELGEMDKDLPYKSLRESVPKTIIISNNCNYEGNLLLSFPFIPNEENNLSTNGLTLSPDLKIEEGEKESSPSFKK